MPQMKVISFAFLLLLARSDFSEGSRSPRSLAFPFNVNLRNINSESLRDPRQSQNAIADSDVTIDIGTVAAAGEVCIDKVVMVEETEYDDVIECKHSYTTRCHETYNTNYSPQQEEECEELFKKNCFIEFKKRASKETIRVCNTPLVKNCDIQGPEECTTEYTTQCVTRYQEHEVKDDIPDCTEENEVKCVDVTQGYTTEQKCSKWPVKKCKLNQETVKKYTPETTCKKVPFQICGPSACPTEPGPEVCINKEETFVEDKPQEECNLQPQKSCKLVTKLIPLLKAVENCIDVPKEICSRSQRNPRRVKVPIIKQWCYTPKLESETGIKPGSEKPRTTTPRPSCSTTCITKSRDGVCNPECNNPLCDFDGGDCVTTTTRTTTPRFTTTQRTTTPRITTTTQRTTTPRGTTQRTTTPRITTQRTTTTTTPNIGYLPPYSG